LADTPQLEDDHFQAVDEGRLFPANRATHAPRILLLYGSLRARSFSRLMSEEAVRVLSCLGAEPRTFNPSGLPLPDDADADHPKVQELRELVAWSEGMVWCSPERHGSMTAVMKAQIDWIPLSIGAVRPTQGKTLAVMQVCGGSQSFNAASSALLTLVVRTLDRPELAHNGPSSELPIESAFGVGADISLSLAG
jgi:arsenic resistance protein ArsH